MGKIIFIRGSGELFQHKRQFAKPTTFLTSNLESRTIKTLCKIGPKVTISEGQYV